MQSTSSSVAGELLCAPKQFRHYQSPNELLWDEVEQIGLQNAASLEQADELEEMTAEDMAVDGYYVVAGIPRHEYNQCWKFLILWEGYGASEETWEPIFAFIQPNGGINPIFCSYLIERYVGGSSPDWGCLPGGSYQGAFAHPPTALLQVPPQSSSRTWGKGAVAASSTLLRVLPREVTHVRPKSHTPLLRADDTWGRVPSHILINLQILGPRRPEPGQRPCPAGTPTWVGF